MSANSRSPASPHHVQAPQAHKPYAVLIDGSALFLASRSIGDGTARLNYRRIIDVLVSKVDGLEAPQGNLGVNWVMWTAAVPDNEGQQKFLDFAERELRWQVRRYYPSQSFMIEPMALFGLGGGDSSRTSRLVRFDAPIAFAMGRLADSHRLVVMSDSYALADPLSRVAEHFSQPTLTFFGRALDPRWHSALKNAKAPKFVDFDDYETELFGLPKKEERPEKRSEPIF